MKKYYPAPEGRHLLSPDKGDRPSDLRCGTSLTQEEQDRSNFHVRSLRRRARFAGWVLNNSPFSRCVILNGSYASGDASPDSDIDILLIGKSGRIFTARFFAVLLMSLVGIKRSNNRSADHAGKVCLNYYLTDDFLKIPTGRGDKIDRYCAKNYSQAKFLSGDYRLFEKFMKTNEKLFNKFLKVESRKYKVESGKFADPGCHPELDSGSRLHGFRIPSASLSSSLSEEAPDLRVDDRACKSGMTINGTRILENLLSGKFGDKIEKWLKAIQIRRIESDPITGEYPELIVYNDRELRFHPPKTVKSKK